MPSFIQFTGWSGKDDAVARGQLTKVFKLKTKQSETVMEILAQGRKWKYGTAVGDTKADQAVAFFKKLGFELELLPVESKNSATEMVAAVSPDISSNTITAENFEIPGLVWVTDESPEEEKVSNDRRLLDIKRTPVPLVILFLIFTFGLYGIFWFLGRLEALNNLDSKSKISSGLFQGLFLLSGGWMVFTVLDIFFDVNFGIDMVLFVISIILTITFIVQAFKVRRILLDHFDANFSGLKIVSGGLTFFLGVIFLQYKINGIHDWYEREEEGEIQLNSDGLAWTFAILLLVVAPFSWITYSVKSTIDEFNEDGTLSNSFSVAYQLESYFAMCEEYWDENGDHQICTKEEVEGGLFSYSEDPKVKVTGSGTRETFQAEAVYEGSDVVFTINNEGEIGIKNGDESYVIEFEEKSGA